MGLGRVMKGNGMTLFEVLVVLAIVAILWVLAYPSMMNYLYGAEARRIQSILTLAHQEARIESYIKKQNVVMCLATQDNQCHKTADAQVLVFYDRDNNQQLNAGELVSRYDLALKYGKVEMRASASRDYMKYFGSTSTPKGHFGHIKYCSVSMQARFSYRAVVSMQGRVSVQEGC